MLIFSLKCFFFSAYIWVVHKDASHPVGIAMTKKNPGHGKKPDPGMDFELLIDDAYEASVLQNSTFPLLVFIL